MTERTRYYVANIDNPTLVWGNMAPGYTETKGFGHFEGVREPTTIIEVIGGFNIQWCTNMLVQYAARQGEDSVLVTRESAELGLLAWLVYDDRGGTVIWEKIA